MDVAITMHMCDNDINNRTRNVAIGKLIIELPRSMSDGNNIYSQQHQHDRNIFKSSISKHHNMW